MIKDVTKDKREEELGAEGVIETAVWTLAIPIANSNHPSS
jgi:hypothetical protein